MKRAVFAAFLLILVASAGLRAEPIPEMVLDKDFTSCMGGETPEKDPQRAQYCQCVRDSMKNWSLEDYQQLAEQESKARNAQEMPASLQEIAKACITKIMGSTP
jgi:hypothetical protein